MRGSSLKGSQTIARSGPDAHQISEGSSMGLDVTLWPGIEGRPRE